MVMLVVEVMENPLIKIEMDSFGTVVNGVCVGCIATNVICKIAGKVFDETNIYSREERAEFIGVDGWFLRWFEVAIDLLRSGMIHHYNAYASENEFVKLKAGEVLPAIRNKYGEEEIRAFKNFANYQEQ